ncbi:MAG TPA: hypothetical protein VFG15_18775 [Amycolatopsis sp.]|nr:hypothetical protein [Amycolatopsis sp.]
MLGLDPDREPPTEATAESRQRVVVRVYRGDNHRHVYLAVDLARRGYYQIHPMCNPVLGYGLAHVTELIGPVNFPDLGNCFDACESCAVWLQRHPHEIFVDNEVVAQRGVLTIPEDLRSRERVIAAGAAMASPTRCEGDRWSSGMATAGHFPGGTNDFSCPLWGDADDPPCSRSDVLSCAERSDGFGVTTHRALVNASAARSLTRPARCTGRLDADDHQHRSFHAPGPRSKGDDHTPEASVSTISHLVMAAGATSIGKRGVNADGYHLAWHPPRESGVLRVALFDGIGDTRSEAEVWSWLRRSVVEARKERDRVAVPRPVSGGEHP